jgi:hypothetical protein
LRKSTVPCGTIRRRINFSATASPLASRPENQQKGIAHPLVGGAAWAILARLPAVIEPAIHPHHRQFLHRVAFAGLVDCGLHRAYPLAEENTPTRVIGLKMPRTPGAVAQKASAEKNISLKPTNPSPYNRRKP